MKEPHLPSLSYWHFRDNNRQVYKLPVVISDVEACVAEQLTP